MATLTTLAAQIKALEAEIAAQLAAHPDAHIFTCLPRAGTVRAARLLAEIGDCRSRFPDPESLAGLAGVAPVTRQSGKHTSIGFRWAVNRQLRDAVCDFAADSRHASPWAAAIYDAARARGKDHPHAVRITARAWIYVIWRCWQDGTAYDPAKHHALQRILGPARPGPRPGSRRHQDTRAGPVTAMLPAALARLRGRPVPRRSQHRTAHQPRRVPAPPRLRPLRAHRHQHQRRHHRDGADRLGRRDHRPARRAAARLRRRTAHPPAHRQHRRRHSLSPSATPSPAWTTATCDS